MGDPKCRDDNAPTYPAWMIHQLHCYMNTFNADHAAIVTTVAAFEHTYSGNAKSTSFTKVSIDLDADRELLRLRDIREAVLK